MPKYKLLTKTLAALMAVLLIVLGVSTVVERSRGTAYVGEHVYHTVWFCGCWTAVALLGAVAFLCSAARRRLPLLLLHVSFLVILGGALITFVWGRQGVVHLRPGAPVSTYRVMETGEVLRFPFTLTLDTFVVENYPGTEAPSDYVSRMTCRTGDETFSAVISMNHILEVEGYRLYQSSFDEDRRGSWLSVNYDPWGTGITYTGYVLLAVGMIWTLLSRKEEFRALLRHPLLKKGSACLAFLLLLAPAALTAQPRTLPVLNRGQADSLGRVQVIYQDRVAPFNTLARDFVQKIYGRTSYHGFTAEQVVGGWLLSPETWRHEPFIRIKSAALKRHLNLKGDFVSLANLYEGDAYRLQTLWDDVRSDGQDGLVQGILETDEKVGLILMLQEGTLVKPVSETPGAVPVSVARLKAELLYNRIPFTKILFMAALTLGLLSFFRLLYKGPRRLGSIDVLLRSALYGMLLFHAVGYLLRWYIAGRVPLSNGFETMQFLALCILVLAVGLHRRFPFALAFGFILTGFTLLVSYIGQMSPQITPLMPVLASPLLSLHVTVIMMAYALLAFTFLNGVLALVLLSRGIDGERVEQLTVLSRLLLYPAVFFLGGGIFLGAVWANVSWGSYWSWDPKEVWALITFLTYGAAFHRQSLSRFRRPAFFHAYMILAFLTILMTYFGVNYLLGGMHSYAG